MNDPGTAPLDQAGHTRQRPSVVSGHEREYWKRRYKSRPYVDDTDTYADFGPAYAFGLQLFRTRSERVPSDLKLDLADDWNASRGGSSLRWDRAKHAAYEAWERLAQRFEPGNAA